jgi:beta-galactosidase GanA
MCRRDSVGRLQHFRGLVAAGPGRRVVIVIAMIGFPFLLAYAQGSGIPRLEKQGAATQLIVDGKPFLILGAELLNSSSSSLDYMRPIWPRLASIPLNTVLTPLSWELIEPREGQFDFTLPDGLIRDARRNNLRLVFLWLASWKNGMSSYAPLWVKQDTHRFPRVIEKDGATVEILSTFGKESMQADAHAFAALMRHIRDVDGEVHTVLMMQVENEVGVLGDLRDRSPAANQAFDGPVPKQLMSYIQQHHDTLLPEFRRVWEAAGSKDSGTWAEVFGPGPQTDEIFMAWNYARYVQHVAAAGKAEHPLPMYVNTWLAEPQSSPGQFPSGGPLPEVMDVWKAAGTALDIYAPDIYAPNFAEWCDRYNRAGNPLFIPETRGGTAGQANVFYAIGQRETIGFSPFAIDAFVDTDRPALTDPNGELGKSYEILMQLAPIILQYEGKGKMAGFLLDRDHPQTTLELSGYRLDVSLDEIFGTKAQSGFGLVIGTGPEEFLGAGSGFRISFRLKEGGQGHVGIGSVDEGTFSENAWIPGRRLNGDENDQGKGWRFAPNRIRIEKVVLYRY